MAKKGVPLQTLTAITEIMARVGSPSQLISRGLSPTFIMSFAISTGEKPRNFRNWSFKNQLMVHVKTLKRESYIHNHPRVERAVGTTQGRRTDPRITLLNFNFLLRSRASERPIVALNNIAETVNTKEFLTVWMKISSVNSSR